MSSARRTPGTCSTSSAARTGSTRRAADAERLVGIDRDGARLRHQRCAATMSSATPWRMPPRPTQSGVPRRRIAASKISAPAGSRRARVGSSWNCRAICCRGARAQEAERARERLLVEQRPDHAAQVRGRAGDGEAVLGRRHVVRDGQRGIDRLRGCARSPREAADRASMKRSLRRPEPSRNERDHATPSAVVADDDLGRAAADVDDADVAALRLVERGERADEGEPRLLVAVDDLELRRRRPRARARRARRRSPPRGSRRWRSRGSRVRRAAVHPRRSARRCRRPRRSSGRRCGPACPRLWPIRAITLSVWTKVGWSSIDVGDEQAHRVRADVDDGDALDHAPDRSAARAADDALERLVLEVGALGALLRRERARQQLVLRRVRLLALGGHGCASRCRPPAAPRRRGCRSGTRSARRRPRSPRARPRPGVQTSTRASRLRGIRSAEPMYVRVPSTSVNWKTRSCSRKRPSSETTRMPSESPGTPGRRQQMPRTIRSMRTPACEAA